MSMLTNPAAEPGAPRHVATWALVRGFLRRHRWDPLGWQWANVRSCRCCQDEGDSRPHAPFCLAERARDTEELRTGATLPTRFASADWEPRNKPGMP